MGGFAVAILTLIVVGIGGVIHLHGRSADAASAAPSASASPRSDAETVRADRVDPGDCLKDSPSSGVVTKLSVIPCAQPHKAEAYAQTDLPDGAFPGDQAVAAKAEQACSSRFQAFIGRSYDESVVELTYLHPIQQSWELGDRSVLCMVEMPNGAPVQGTLRGSRR